jgi:hypothetical protein
MANVRKQSTSHKEEFMYAVYSAIRNFYRTRMFCYGTGFGFPPSTWASLSARAT